MTTVTKKFEFESAHQLHDHPGLCKNLHGHTYKLEVTVQGAIDEKTGMIIDFGKLKDIVNERIIINLDHKYLNDEFDFIPTAENMVDWIVLKLMTHLDIIKIRLYETSNSYAQWEM